MARVLFAHPHDCPYCGLEVQPVDRGYGRRRLEETYTGKVHQCPRNVTEQPRHDLGVGPVYPRLRECPTCEAADVFEYEGVYYEALGVTLSPQHWQRHACARATDDTDTQPTEVSE